MAARRRLALAAAAALVWITVPPPEAMAHALVIRADPPDLCSSVALPRLAAGDPRCAAGTVLPSPPASVHLFFNERVQLVGRGVRVVAPDGRRVDRGPVRIDGPEVAVGIDAAQPGTYLVTWRVVSADTHPAVGTFVFSVGHAGSPPRGAPDAGGAASASSVGLLLQVLARAVHFAGYALGFGAFAFLVLVLRPLGLEGSRAEGRVWWLVGLGVFLLLSAEPIALLAQATSLGGGEGGPFDPDAVSSALDSIFGRVLAQRVGAALLLWVLLGAARDAPSRATGASARATGAVALVGVALAWVDGQAAHAVGVRPVWLGMGLNTLHVAAMGVWIGGLAALLSVWRGWETDPALGPVAGRAGIAVRAGRLFGAAAGALAVTGIGMAVQHLRAPADLFTTPYGRTLAVKLIVLLIVLLLALRASRSVPADRPPWWTREAAALLAVLILAGFLVSLPPPV